MDHHVTLGIVFLEPFFCFWVGSSGALSWFAEINGSQVGKVFPFVIHAVIIQFVYLAGFGDAKDFLYISIFKTTWQMALKVCRNDPEVPPGIYVNVLNNIGEINYLRQDYETALKYYQEAFGMAEKKMADRPELVAVYRKNVESAKGKMKK